MDRKIIILATLAHYSVISVVSLFCVSLSAAPAKPRLLIVDTAIDYSMPGIDKSLSQPELGLTTVNFENKVVSLMHLNSLKREQQWSAINGPFGPDNRLSQTKQLMRNIDTVELLMKNSNPEKSLSTASKAGLLLRTLLPWVSEELISTVWFIHGTHVTNLAIAGLEGQVSLLNFPMFEYSKILNSSWLNLDWISQKITTDFENLSHVISSGKIQYVNISAGSSQKLVRDMLSQNLDGSQALLNAQTITSYATRVARKWRIALERVIHAHPQTLFLLAAGNEAEWIDSLVESSSKIKAPNLIIVGATNKNALASYSNFSNDFVTLTADGDGLALVHGTRSLNLQGTSSATPKVMNCLLHIAVKHPEINPLAAKAAMLNHFVDFRDNLKTSVAKGRELKPGTCAL
jgi:hypothetical protein